MNINNIHLSRPNTQPPDPAPPASSDPRDGKIQGIPGETSHEPSAELLNFLQQVRQEPEIRDDLLREIAQKLASGFYLTDAAARQTAEAIQNSPE